MAQLADDEPAADAGQLEQQQNEELQRATEDARREAEEQQRAADEEQQRNAEEQQRAAQQESDRQAAEQQRASEQAQREAAEQQRAIEEQRAQEEQQRQSEAEEAAREAAEQQRIAEKQRQEEAAEQERAARDEAERQAEEQRRAAEQSVRQQDEPETKTEDAPTEPQTDAQKHEAEPSGNSAGHPGKDSGTDAGDQDATAPQVEKGEPGNETPQQPASGDQQQPGTTQPDQSADTPASQDDSTTQQPAQSPSAVGQTPDTDKQPDSTDSGSENGEPAGMGTPTQADDTSVQPQDPADGDSPAALTDQRSTKEKQEIASDPAKTDDTVVLPVENGAAILDSDKDADNAGGNQSREERRKLREQQRVADQQKLPPPADDAAAQATFPEALKVELPQKIEANRTEEGTRVRKAPDFALPDPLAGPNNTVINNTTVNNTVNNTTVNNVTSVKVIEQVDNRVLLDAGDHIFVRGDDRPRLRRDAEETYYDQLPRGRVRETIVRPGGREIVTVYDRYGDILQRSRIDRDGNEFLMIYAPEDERRPRRPVYDVGYELPPMRLTVPVRDYIIDVKADPDRDFYDFLAQPPVERVERVYSVDEVRNSARLRDKVRRIDLDTIRFATGSAEVSLSQAKTLRKVAVAMQRILSKDPGETFFIEGHTDAVGSDRSNLILSDKRAESVAALLTEVYDIPAENLVTQGYGERFLKIRTQAAEQENRRVTIRRVTPLVRPVAQR
jgi:outer membrane protein OmpA-like peptidoglycan-associated protein